MHDRNTLQGTTERLGSTVVDYGLIWVALLPHARPATRTMWRGKASHRRPASYQPKTSEKGTFLPETLVVDSGLGFRLFRASASGVMID